MVGRTVVTRRPQIGDIGDERPVAGLCSTEVGADPLRAQPAAFVAEARSIDFCYDEDEPILAGFDVQLRRGEILVLLGPSGCGKSTAMNLIAGLLAPNRGQVLFEGEPLNGVNRGVGYMTQGDTLLPWRTVAANIGLPLSLRRVPRAESRERVDHFLDLLDLRAAQDKYPSELSGGMKRRALLARSLIYEPSILLMDEPFAALDAQLRERMQQQLIDTIRRLDQSALFITHDLVEAILVGDRIIVMGRRGAGVLLEVESPLGRERDLEAARVTAQFVELEKRLRQALREA